MSYAGISIALGDKGLTGELRLAYMAVGDCTGVVSISSVMDWCNCNEAKAENLVTCCQSCNSSKGTKSYIEFLFWRAGLSNG